MSDDHNIKSTLVQHERMHNNTTALFYGKASTRMSARLVKFYFSAVLTDWAAACATPTVSCLDALCACFTEYLLTIHSRFAPGMGAFSFPGIRE